MKIPGKQKVFIGIGSNVGNREKNFFNAYHCLIDFLNCTEMANIYETVPMYVKEQPEFLNSVISGFTKLTPLSLLKSLEQIEVEMGRNKTRSLKMGPRCIDLDILLYGDQIVQTETLTIPHARIKEREFVLKPLIELAPDLQDPVDGEFYSSFLHLHSNQGVVFYSTWETILNKKFKKRAI